MCPSSSQPSTRNTNGVGSLTNSHGESGPAQYWRSSNGVTRTSAPTVASGVIGRAPSAAERQVQQPRPSETSTRDATDEAAVFSSASLGPLEQHLVVRCECRQHDLRVPLGWDARKALGHRLL